MSPTPSNCPTPYLNDSIRQHLRDQTKDPVSWDTGADYDHPHSNLNDYQTFRSSAFPQLSKAEATQILADFLTPLHRLPASQKEALNRLDAAARHPSWDPSLVIKALADLDIAFFDGRLKGSVVAVWATEREIVEKVLSGVKHRSGFKGLCQPLAPEENEGQQRCKIWLNSDSIFDVPDPRLQMWQTMFHELVHAYALISSDRECFIDYHALSDPYHDDQFNYLLSLVDRRSVHHMEIPAKRAGKGHTICLKCCSRPLMHGDKDFGNDELGQMLRDQQNDPKWEPVPVEGPQESLSDS